MTEPGLQPNSELETYRRALNFWYFKAIEQQKQLRDATNQFPCGQCGNSHKPHEEWCAFLHLGEDDEP